GQLRRAAGGISGAPREHWLAILVADLDGYSRVCTAVEPEVLWDVMTDWWRHVADAVYSEMGWLNKVDGDGVMALFGLHTGADIPSASAATCALLIAEHFAGYADAMDVLRDNKVGIRLGFEAGDVVAGVTVLGPQPVYDVLGRAVNFAFQLSDTAQSNAILAGPNVHDRTEDAFDYERFGEIAVKGTEERALAYRLLGRL
ncbi:MAG: adenylate/guanylate cyclase domain-containing protein, partial [Armatimonadota bacterium]